MPKLSKTILEKLEKQHILEYLIEIEQEIEVYKANPKSYLKTDLEIKISDFIKKINLATASLRAPLSIKDQFSFPKIMQTIDQYLVGYGGHDLAAGFSAKNENLSAIELAFEEEVNKLHLSYNNFNSNLIQIDINDIDSNMLNYIYAMDPFGIDFPQPFFVTTIHSSDSLKINVLNSKKNGSLKHLKIINKNGINIMIFNLKSDDFSSFVLDDKINPQISIELILKTSQNSFNEKTTFQLICDSFRFLI